MSDILFPTDTTSVTPATGDIILIADVSDSNNPKDCTLAELPISTATQTALNAKQDTITGLTASGAELNILDGATLSTTELNYVDGVTSAIQTQLNAKQGTITLTTTGTSGASTLIGDTLNIPQYSGGGGGSSTFIGLTDVPSSYTGQAGKFPKVNVGETALEFVTISGGGDMLASTYDPANIAQQVVGTTATQTISGKTLTSPKFADNGFIADSNGNEMLSFNLNASAVNYLELENGATGNPPHLRAMGDDTNVGLHLVGKGTGEVSICDATDETKRIRFQASGNSTGVITTLASSDTAAHTITLPNATDTLVGKATPDTLTNKSISLGTNTVTSTFAQLNTAVTDADLARTDAANTFTGTQTITQIDLGNTDTSITRVSAGVISVEGVTVPTISSTSTLTNKTLTAPIITYSINAQTGTTYTLVLTDQSKLVTLTNASAIAVTIPTNASVAFPVGTQIDFSQDGAGKVTFSGAGVTINSLSSLKSIGGQYVGATLVKTATDTWNLYGNLVA